MARVTFEGRRYPLLDDDSVLQALVRGGANIPFSCRRGTCQTCVMHAIEGDPGGESRAGLRESLVRAGYFLPCRSRPSQDLVIGRPDPSKFLVRAHVHDKVELAPGIVRVRLETETSFVWRPGQFVNVRAPSGLSRSYSLASLPDEDYYLELHVERVAGGAVSGWLVDEVAAGDVIELDGPVGECCYDPGDRERAMLLVATGTGLSPLIGVARDALARGHSGPVFLHHGAREAEALYLGDVLRALEARHPTFHYVPCVSGSGELPAGAERGRALDVALARHPSLAGYDVFLCGAPSMVHEGRHRAYAAGAERGRIHADPFEGAQPFMPEENVKLARLEPDAELWDALEHGVKLRAILTDFYDLVYEDPRLAPFFHKVTKQRAIDKQYAFLADVLTGRKDYFGLKPFNAHHWMVISDELFDHRERLIEGVMRRHGLAEHLVRRWCSIHELFRREIVKSTARGLVIDGVERHLDGFSEETLELDCLCDGCGGEMPALSLGRLHVRTGELFCLRCSARAVGSTLQPPPC